jgi:hypothetical protein
MPKCRMVFTVEFDDDLALLDFQEPRYDERLSELIEQYVEATTAGRARLVTVPRHSRPSEEIMAMLDAERLGIPVKDGVYDEERYRAAVFKRARERHAKEYAFREQQRQRDAELDGLMSETEHYDREGD